MKKVKYIYEGPLLRMVGKVGGLLLFLERCRYICFPNISPLACYQGNPQLRIFETTFKNHLLHASPLSTSCQPVLYSE